MLFAFDDDVWKAIIGGGYTLIGGLFVAFLNYKLNKIQRQQFKNSAKIDVAAEKADVAANAAQKVATHLDNQDCEIKQVKQLSAVAVEKMDEVHRATNGIKDELVEAARKVALAEGIALGKKEARSRSTDQEKT